MLEGNNTVDNICFIHRYSYNNNNKLTQKHSWYTGDDRIEMELLIGNLLYYYYYYYYNKFYKRYNQSPFCNLQITQTFRCLL